MIIQHKNSVIKNMFVVINKGDKSIGKNKCIYPLSGIYYNFIVSLYESWIDGQSDELKNKIGVRND